MLDWFRDNQTLISWATGASIAVFVASLIVVPITVLRLPAGYFQRSRREWGKDTWVGRHPSARFALRVARNILGWALILAGLAMLVLPGQGVLVTLIGIALAEFPGKFRLERWLISRPRVLGPVNRFRTKHGRPPLEVDGVKSPSG